ncbi:hypothetical protein EDE05_102437 [Neorhizobium sp. R1-B]|uniref:hypothetical protein n=1 Tax=Neorhizobium sp. R1-B TaxID=2485162 RepID=UPI00106515BF|nr:hypothetical protein [Neorhizobium sp. R1-B]TDX88460.1 hypothetical protein EDE05_102437 [Neorhizobium sp. R1-B]
MKKSSIEELSEKRSVIDVQVTRLIEEDVSSVLAGGTIKNSALISRLGQDRNTLDAAIDRLRDDEQH